MSVETALEKYPGLRERLGQETDSALAEEFGLSRGRIYQFRDALGISPLKPKGKADRVLTFRNRAFADLRQVWLDANPGKTIEDLAENLETRAARITAWTIGSENRQPPWEMMTALANLVGKEIRMREDGICITSKSRRGSGDFYERRPGERF